MPKRPVSHQLEDESRRRFEDLLPKAWISRTKSHDYGTDVEVEIFDGEGQATGIVFLVQLKATDDLQSADRLRLDIDHLDYFDALDLPTLIARYCRADDSFRIRWNFNVERPLDEGSADERKSLTIRFNHEDLWTPATPGQIETTMAVLRRIKNLDPTQPVALAADSSALAPPERFHLDEAIHDAAEIAPVLTAMPLFREQVAIQVIADPGRLRVRIERVSEFTFALDRVDAELLSTNILYGSAALLGKHRLHQHAARVAAAILRRGQPCADPEIAFAACRALSASPGASVDLAILNRLHHQDNVFGLLFMGNLRFNAMHPEERYEAMLKYSSAMQRYAAECSDPFAEAAAYYTIGNIHRSSGMHAAAVRAYNQARKLRPGYLQSPYYLYEVGSCLFMSGHYRSAAEWYLAANSAGQPRMSFVLGDALLFAGRASEAIPHFRNALDDLEQDGGHEAAVKLRLCMHLIQRFGPALPLAHSAAGEIADAIERGQSSKNWSDVVATDALHALGNFNAGVTTSHRGRYHHAWVHFLIAAFRVPTDEEAWANSILCALNDETSDMLASTMSCAIRLGGRQAYRRFRRDLVLQGASGDLLANLDEMSRTLSEEIWSLKDRGLTIRFLEDDPPHAPGTSNP